MVWRVRPPKFDIPPHVIRPLHAWWCRLRQLWTEPSRLVYDQIQQRVRRAHLASRWRECPPHLFRCLVQVQRCCLRRLALGFCMGQRRRIRAFAFEFGHRCYPVRPVTMLGPYAWQQPEESWRSGSTVLTVTGSQTRRKSVYEYRTPSAQCQERPYSASWGVRGQTVTVRTPLWYWPIKTDQTWPRHCRTPLSRPYLMDQILRNFPAIRKN